MRRLRVALVPADVSPADFAEVAARGAADLVNPLVGLVIKPRDRPEIENRRRTGENAGLMTSPQRGPEWLCGDHRHGGGAYDAAVVSGDVGVDAWEQRGGYHDVSGHRVFVVDRSPTDGGEGARSPVLVLHGFPTSSHDWHRVLDRFAHRHRVVVPDLLGFGLSDKPDQRYSLFEQADLVEAIAGDLGLDEVALVSHDMGDSVGGELLARSLGGTLSFEVTRRLSKRSVSKSFWRANQ